MNEAMERTMFDVLTGFEDCLVYVDRIRDMLQIYDEHLESELKILKNNGGQGTVAFFLDRNGLLKSLLDSIRMQLYDISDEMGKNIECGYEIEKKNRAAG